MKKSILLICFITCISLYTYAASSKKKVDKEPTIKFEKNMYSFKGKYRNYSWPNEEFLKVLLKHPLIYNANYNFLAPENFTDFITFNYGEWNLQSGNNIFRVGTINYNYYDKKTDSLVKTHDVDVIIGDYKQMKDEAIVTREEWDDFILFLKEVKYKEFFVDKDFLAMIKNKNITIEDWVSKEKQEINENSRLSMSNVVSLCLSFIDPFYDNNQIPLVEGDIIYFERGVNNNWCISNVKSEDNYKLYLIEYSNIQFYLAVSNSQNLLLADSLGKTYVMQNVRMQYLNDNVTYLNNNVEHKTLLFKYLSD